MKIKTGISIIMALLMIISTLAIGTLADTQSEPEETLDVTKEVWDPAQEQWVNQITAHIGDVVRFKITVAYTEKIDPEHGYRATDIVIKDTLPECLTYANDVKITYGTEVFTGESCVDGQIIWWNLTEDYDTAYNTFTGNLELYLKGTEQNPGNLIPDNVTIEFNATVVDDGENVNYVEVNATEHCSGLPMFGDASATVLVEELQCGSIDVTKKIFDGCGWADSYEAELGEDVLFNITITYHAGCGETLTDIVVTDNYDIDGVLAYTIHDFSYAPSEQHDSTIIWNLTDDFGIHLSDGESVSIEFYVTPTSVEGLAEFDNCVDVNAIEHCCGCQLSGCDCTNFTVEQQCEPGIEVVKKVWNGTAWSEYVDGLTLGDIVKFKIEVIYHDCGTGYEILNMNVVDELPCCLEYLSTIDVTSTGPELDPADITVDTSGKVVTWDWVFDNHVVLHDGDVLTIEFEANMTNYCEGIDDNWAYVEAWGCSGDHFFGEDNATVDCTPPVPKFDKKARLDDVWQDDEIEVKKGDTVQFGLGLEYYGEEALDDIQFVDIMPCILEYRDNVVISLNNEDVTDDFTVELSEDGKTIWFNSTGSLIIEDGDSIVVCFDAEVVGVTGECQECADVVNYAYVTGLVGCPGEPFFMDDDITIISGCPSCPPSIPSIRGPTSGETGQELTFYFVTEDPDEDQVYYMIDFGGDVTGWIGPSDSGVEIYHNYTFDEVETYIIKAKAKDSEGHESEWTPAGYEHEVVITEAPVPDEKELNVSVSTLSFGRIIFTVENVGDVNMENVDWIVNVTGGLLGRVEYEVNCTIDSIEVGDSVRETTGWPIGSSSIPSGFGRVTVKISLTDGDYTQDFEFEGWLIGKILLMPPTYSAQ
ncbi:MAG: hypothetical protein DRO67_06585 [Candidatus Asgardarchaeum californiense]|nr:MAG: hypothetical protein DRO67_06585 [Candidatus Asgardarchaeum californiense]